MLVLDQSAEIFVILLGFWASQIYGILPEMLEEKDLPGGNGYVRMWIFSGELCRGFFEYFNRVKSRKQFFDATCHQLSVGKNETGRIQ